VPKEKQKGKGARVRSTPKGRRVDPAARQDVRELLGSAPRRRDLLTSIPQIQDRFGCCRRCIWSRFAR
jgi:formate dehydrogenase